MGAARICMCVVAIALGACTGNVVEGTSGGFGGAIGGPEGFTSAGAGSTTGLGEGTGGEAGGTRLQGALAFTPNDAFATSQEPGNAGTTIVIDSGQAGCNASENDSSDSLHIGLPSTAAIGSYNLDGGVTVTLYDFTQSQSPLESAVSGIVYIDRVDESVIGGNFDVIFPQGDGGSELSGIFGATRCP